MEIFIRGYAQLATAPAPPASDDPFATSPYSRRLAAVLDAAAYPRLTQAIEQGVFDTATDDLERALDTLLDGIGQPTHST